MPNYDAMLLLFFSIIGLMILVVVGLALTGFFMISTGHCPHCEHALSEDDYHNGFCTNCTRFFDREAVSWE